MTTTLTPELLDQLLAGYEKLEDLTGDDGLFRRLKKALIERALGAELTDHLGDDGVLLDVPYPRQAPRHYHAMLRPFQFIRSALYNALRLPATACPMGLVAGLPTGVQVIAAPGRDDLTLAVAGALEQACGGWVDPCSQLS